MIIKYEIKQQKKRHEKNRLVVFLHTLYTRREKKGGYYYGY